MPMQGQRGRERERENSLCRISINSLWLVFLIYFLEDIVLETICTERITSKFSVFDNISYIYDVLNSKIHCSFLLGFKVLRFSFN